MHVARENQRANDVDAGDNEESGTTARVVLLPWMAFNQLLTDRVTTNTKKSLKTKHISFRR